MDGGLVHQFREAENELRNRTHKNGSPTAKSRGHALNLDRSIQKDRDSAPLWSQRPSVRMETVTAHDCKSEPSIKETQT